MPNAEQVPSAHLVLMGVSGCGKTTIAKELAKEFGFELGEADDFHPAGNIKKMASGQPLTDEDRWPWLEILANWLRRQDKAGKHTVITCSALKRAYRSKLQDANAPLIFVHLDGTRELLLQRLHARRDHFMPAALLDSQLNTLEPLQEDEKGFVVNIDDSPTNIAKSIMEKLNAVT